MASWRIEILDDGVGGVAFRPFVPGSQPGDRLRAGDGDTVVWTNRTNRDLTLVSTDDPAINQSIEAGGSSPHLYVVSGSPRDIVYACIAPRQDHVVQAR